MTIGCSVLPPDFRARIEGAVVRLPGTGDGVARLVEVSMVKVDMRPAHSGYAAPQQNAWQAQLTDNGPINGRPSPVARVPRASPHKKGTWYEDVDPARDRTNDRSRLGCGACRSAGVTTFGNSSDSSDRCNAG